MVVLNHLCSSQHLASVGFASSCFGRGCDLQGTNDTFAAELKDINFRWVWNNNFFEYYMGNYIPPVSNSTEVYTSDAGTFILPHDIDSAYKKLPTISEGGNLHFLRLEKWPMVKAFDDGDELYRGFQKACTKTKRLFTMYLMVGK